MKRLLVIFICTLAVALPVKAESNIEIFQSANKFYKSGDYNKALENYKKLTDLQINNAYLFYNLGNTYEKLGQNGNAMANYIKAKNLLPRDSKINQSLNQLSEKLQYESSITDRIFNAFKYFNFKELLITFMIFWFILFICLLNNRTNILKLDRKISGNISLIILPFIIYFSLSLLIRFTEYSENQGLITVQEADIKVSTNNEDITLFKLKEGQKFEITEETNNWAKVSFNDNKGWINKNSFEKISVL